MGANSLPIPRSAEEITPEWLTAALRSSGVIAGTVAVTAVMANQIDDSQAQSGWYSDLTITYSTDSPGLPDRVFVKGHRSDTELFAEYAFRMFVHELIFYTQVSPKTATRVPQLYHGALDRDRQQAILLMESLSNDTLTSLEAGFSHADAGVILHELAGLHGRWWNSPEIDEIEWAGDPFRQLAAEYLEPHLPGIWDRIKHEAPELLTEHTARLGDAVVGRVAELWEHMLTHPRTLLQMDPRAGNVAIREVDGERTAILFDWIVGPGPAASDLGLMLLTGLDDGDAGSLANLLRGYCRRLETEGVAGYTIDDAMEDLRLGALSAFAIRLFTMGAYLDLGPDHLRSASRKAAFNRVSRWVERLGVTSELI